MVAENHRDDEENAPPAASEGSDVRRAVTAVRWTVFGSVLQRLATFAAVAILTRLLTQTEYGAYRQLLSLHLVLFVLLPLGFDQLYIREVARRKHFALLLAGATSLTAVLMALVLVVAHPVVSRLMDFAPWDGLLWLAPAVILVQGWKIFYKTGLVARLDYRRISLGEALYAAISGGGAVALAIKWPAAWSLYVAYAAAEVIELIWVARGQTISLPRIKDAVAEFFRDAWNWRRFGVYHCGMQVLNATTSNAVVLIFGSMISKAAAATFSLAQYLVTVPVYILVGALHRVAYSALAGRSRAELTEPVLRIMAMSAGFIVPVLIYVAVMAEPLVQLALGASWVESTAPVLRWVAVYCIWVPLFSPISFIDLLLDRPDYGFWWNFVGTILRMTAVIAGLQFGVIPAVAAYAITSSVMWLIWGIMLGRLLACGQGRFHSTWARFVPLWVTLGAMLLAVLELVTDIPAPAWITRQWLREMIQPLAVVGASVIPVVIYGAAVAYLSPATMRDALKILRR